MSAIGYARKVTLPLNPGNVQSTEGVKTISKVIRISDDLGKRVQRYLGREGGGDLGEYVNAAIKRQLFWDTVDAVQERNRDLSPKEAEALANEALDWARATRP